MTSTDTGNASVHILIDNPDDGVIDDWAWVKITSITPTPALAQLKLQQSFPVDEQGVGGDTLRYENTQREWLRPYEETEEGWRWQVCAEDAEGAEEFFKFEVVDDG